MNSNGDGFRELRNYATNIESVIDSVFRVGLESRKVIFDGEFDSGSERTLAAWIRHASRAGHSG